MMTLRDVAERAGVSMMTVSNVINHPERVSSTVKEKVDAIIKELGYRPNPTAQSFRRKTTNIIGILLPHEYKESISSILLGAVNEAAKYDQTILVSPSYYTREEEEQAIRYMASKQVDALLYEPRNYNLDLSTIPGVGRIPIIGMLRRNFGMEIPKVYADYFQSGYMSTRYLLSLGRKKIAYVYCAGDYSDIHSVDELLQKSEAPETAGRFVFDDRFQGYLKALEEDGVDFCPDFVFVSDLREEDGKAVAQKILLDGRIDGVIVGGPEFALGMYQKFRQQGISIPQDIAIIGFFDSEVCRALDPTLTVSVMPFYEMGREAVRLANRVLNDEEYEDIILQTNLVIRESTGKSSKNRKKHS